MEKSGFQDITPELKQLTEGYMNVVHSVFGETVDMSVICLSLALYLHECVEFVTREKGNYEEVMNAYRQLTDRMHADDVAQKNNLN